MINNGEEYPSPATVPDESQPSSRNSEYSEGSYQSQAEYNSREQQAENYHLRMQLEQLTQLCIQQQRENEALKSENLRLDQHIRAQELSSMSSKFTNQKIIENLHKTFEFYTTLNAMTLSSLSPTLNPVSQAALNVVTQAQFQQGQPPIVQPLIVQPLIVPQNVPQANPQGFYHVIHRPAAARPVAPYMAQVEQQLSEHLARFGVVFPAPDASQNQRANDGNHVSSAPRNQPQRVSLPSAVNFAQSVLEFVQYVAPQGAPNAASSSQWQTASGFAPQGAPQAAPHAASSSQWHNASGVAPQGAPQAAPHSASTSQWQTASGVAPQGAPQDAPHAASTSQWQTASGFAPQGAPQAAPHAASSSQWQNASGVAPQGAPQAAPHAASTSQWQTASGFAPQGAPQAAPHATSTPQWQTASGFAPHGAPQTVEANQSGPIAKKPRIELAN